MIGLLATSYVVLRTGDGYAAITGWGLLIAFWIAVVVGK